MFGRKNKYTPSQDNIGATALFDAMVEHPDTTILLCPENWRVMFEDEDGIRHPLCGWLEEPYSISEHGFVFQIEGTWEEKPLTAAILHMLLTVYWRAGNAPIVAMYKGNGGWGSSDTYYDIIDFAFDEEADQAVLYGRISE